MDERIIPINGKNNYLNYENFNKSVIDSIKGSCSNFKIFIFNKFPIALNSGSYYDIILFIAIEKADKNYVRIKTLDNGKSSYLFNVIVPLKFVSDFKESTIDIESGQLYVEDQQLDYNDYIVNSKFALIDYFKKVNYEVMDKIKLFPIVFIENGHQRFYKENFIIAGQLDFTILLEYFKNIDLGLLSSCNAWRENFKSFDIHIESIIEQASMDSEFGYLTKKKLDRITKNSPRLENIQSNIGKHLTIIEGKAGSGKTSDLTHLLTENIKGNKNVLYLTYNNLLAYDTALLVKSYINNYTGEKQLKTCTVITIHKFFYKLCKNSNLLNVLSAERINELIKGLKIKMRKVYDFVEINTLKNKDDFKREKERIQQNDWTIELKDFGINFLNYCYQESNNYAYSNLSYQKLAISYFEKIKDNLSEVTAKEIFLADYYNVIFNLKILLDDPDKFYDLFRVNEKLESFTFEKDGLRERYLELEGDKTIISRTGFKEYNRKKFTSFKWNRILILDEAQDCARIEKEILIKIFGSENIVVSSGGVEQLIRHKELCNWAMNESSKIPHNIFTKRGKSYRMKSGIVELSNFLAKYYNLPYHLDSVDSEDEGEIFIDFSKSYEDNFKNIIKYKSEQFSALGFKPYEGGLILLDSSNIKKNSVTNQSNSSTANILINEYDNVQFSKPKKAVEWRIKQDLELKGFMLWDGISSNIRKLPVPSYNEIRTLYYESCRGLEAWSVYCFALDDFFESKYKEEDADKFMLDDIFSNAESRKRKYAINWILMALTRGMDTLYLQIENEESELGRALKEYAHENKKITLLK